MKLTILLVLAALFVICGFKIGWDNAAKGGALLYGLFTLVSYCIKARKRRLAGKVVIEVETDRLAMGGSLKGRVIVTARRPMQDYGISLSLILQALVEVPSREIDEIDDSGVTEEWLDLESVSPDLSDGTGSLAAGESRTVSFWAVAPMHERTADPKSDLWNRWTMADADKIKGMSADELMKKFRLRWLLCADVNVYGLPGPIEVAKELAVTGYRNNPLFPPSDPAQWLLQGPPAKSKLLQAFNQNP